MTPTKRRKGTGSVQQLPSTSWRAIITVTVDGTRRRFGRTFATRDEAAAWLAGFPPPQRCCPYCRQRMNPEAEAAAAAA